MRKKHNIRSCGIWFLLLCLSLVWTGNLALPSVLAAGPEGSVNLVSMEEKTGKTIGEGMSLEATGATIRGVVSENGNTQKTRKDLLVDQAGLLTADEKTEVLSQLNRIRSHYGMDVVIVTADDLGGKDEQDYADDYYDANGYSQDGMLLLVDVDDRLWWISTCGEGMDALPEEEIEDAAGEFLPDLSDGNYKEAFLGYASVCEERIQAFLDDGNDDIYEDDGIYRDDAETKGTAGFSVGTHLLVSLGIGFILALIVVLIMRSQLKTVHFKEEAGDYIKEGSMQLTEKHDWFLYSNVTRTPRPKPEDSGGHDHFGGGGGGHISSSGNTHGGGGGSF